MISRILLATLIALVLLVPPLHSWSRLTTAHSQLQSRQAGYAQICRDAGELIELRARQDQIADRRRPQEHVLAQVNRVLADAGISSRCLRSVRTEGDVALPGHAGRAGVLEYRRQSVNLAFEALDLPELGAFLHAWREHQPVWKPSRIELLKHRHRDATDARYDATIVISAVYAENQTP